MPGAAGGLRANHRWLDDPAVCEPLVAGLPLRPGGVLVVHENIKSRSYTRDYDLMFTVDELEGLLRPLAPIDYFLPTATVQIDGEAAGTKSVFRVLQRAD